MTDILRTVSALRRPRLLVRAARFALDAYDRQRDLARVLGEAALPGRAAVLEALCDSEAAHETARRSRATAYDAALHVEVLAAIMAEARHLPPREPAIR
ncbi:MAG: DUF6477 family protein [Tranquillimonas sp.]